MVMTSRTTTVFTLALKGVHLSRAHRGRLTKRKRSMVSVTMIQVLALLQMLCVESKQRRLAVHVFVMRGVCVSKSE